MAELAEAVATPVAANTNDLAAHTKTKEEIFRKCQSNIICAGSEHYLMLISNYSSSAKMTINRTRTRYESRLQFVEKLVSS